MKTTTSHALSALLALTLSLPTAAWAQERAGVATAVVGAVTVTHVAMPPAPLSFRDDVLLNDRIATGEKAFARVLLGGKAVVTARELSVITITEAPGTSTIDLLTGRISVNVDKSKMRPGEVVEIKTPNAVAGIRGTIVVADARKSISIITVLHGLVDVYRRDPVTGRAFGPPVPVAVRESITVNATVLPPRPQPISVDAARQLSSDFTPPVRVIAPTRTTSVADEVTRARDLLGVPAPAARSDTTETTTPRDVLSTRGGDGDRGATVDKTDKLDKADRLDRMRDRLGDQLDRGDRLDRADRLTDAVDKADKLDRHDRLIDRGGMAVTPDAGGAVERRPMPGGGAPVVTAPGSAPPAGTTPPVIAAPPVGRPMPGSLPTAAVPTVIPMPGVPSARIGVPSAPAPTPVVPPTAPVLNNNTLQYYKFKMK